MFRETVRVLDSKYLYPVLRIEYSLIAQDLSGQIQNQEKM